ncbi:CusA/CzcA family heavy metal efflux RND transporter [Rhodothalassium salexigens]|uniref:efflux RND transporter permease subunit n=1 Tax=Rhodothalassium salexigens TaxID=1086 RepID=UPI0019124D59|nr:CusA/CzcA family heavy metal efflux RND transporter [Rhodothalassium salexigens]MBK5911742.1 CusA/CzcA family heavy metal efflux RND transporter [Rhodothalassium salexigens]
MIDRLIGWSLRNRLMVLVLTAALVIAGALAVKRTPIDAFPDVTPTMVQLFTRAPGLSPVDVETLITYPVEISMYGLPHLDRVQSTSIFGLSRVSVYFEDGTDIYFARRLVMERLAAARREIPKGLGEPELGPISSGLGRVLMYTVENQDDAEHSPMALRTAQDWIVKPMLRTVPGVTGVLSIGGEARQYQVAIDAEALMARGLSVADVRRALAANNRNVGASFINRGGEEYVVRGYGWVAPGDAGLDDIRRIPVAEAGGTPVTVADLARVSYGPAIKRGDLVANGRDAVGGFVLKLIHTNTQDVLGALDERIAAINAALPPGMVLKPYYSQAGLIDKAVGTVRTALIQGAVLVLVLLYLFLGNLRSTLIVIASLPLSILVAFVAMERTGLSVNLMSLGGLAIAIGMMGDGAVVMIENIFRHLGRDRPGAGAGEGAGPADDPSPRGRVERAAREVARPIAFAVAIIVIVFMPLFTLQGVEGKMFKPMAFSISFALLGALLVALTLVPVLASLAFRRPPETGDPWLVRWLKCGYRPLLGAALGRPRAVLAGAVAAFLGALALVPLLGSEFVPSLREGTFQIRSTLPPGANLPTAKDYARRIQTALADFPEVTGTYARVGRAEVGGDPEPVNVVATVVTLKPLDRWQSGRSYEDLQSAMAERLAARVPGLANNVSQPIQLRTDELLSGVMAELVVSIYGEDLDTLARLGGEVAAIARAVPGAVDVRQQQQGGKRQIVVRPDRAALSRYGIAIDELLATVETGVGGAVAGQVFDGIRRFPIFVRLDEGDRDSVDAIANLALNTADGAMVPLSRVADVSVLTGPKQIARAKASRRLIVQLNVRGRDMGGVVAELKRRVAAEVELPPGVYVEYGGQFENQQRAMARLYLVVPVTLALIFLMLYGTFASGRYAALVFLNVPFATTGGIVALWLSGLYLSVPAAVGFIAVFGVAVMNGVVLVSHINQMRSAGHDRDTAVRLGAERRLRPVCMTAVTAVLGLVPLLLADGIGANVQRPLAIVVVGGLVTSTLLTLLVLPAAYRWFAEPDARAPGTRGLARM